MILCLHRVSKCLGKCCTYYISSRCHLIDRVSYVDIIEKAIEVGVSDLKKKANSDWKVKKVVRCITVEPKKTMYGYYNDSLPFVRVSLWRPQDVPYVSSALQVTLLPIYTIL